MSKENNKFDELVDVVSTKVSETIDATKAVANDAREVVEDFKTSDTYANMKENAVKGAFKAGKALYNARKSVKKFSSDLLERFRR